MTRQKKRVFIKGEFFATDGHAIFGDKETAEIITFKDRMVYIGVTSRAKGNEKADESFIKSKELHEYFELSQNTVSSSSQRLEDAGLIYRAFEMKFNNKKNKEEKKWKNTWTIPGRFQLFEKGASKLLIDYNVLRSTAITPRTKMVYFYLCYKSTIEDVNGELQEKARVSREKMAHDLGIKNDENLTASLNELVAIGLVLRLYTRKTTNYGTQVDTPIYTIMELPQWIKNGETVAETITTTDEEDIIDVDSKLKETKKDSEAANNGEITNMGESITSDSINHIEEIATNNSNNLEVDYMSGFLGEFEPTPSYEERGEDVDAFLKEMDVYEEYEEDEEEYIEEEINNVDMFLNDISGTKEEEPVHIPSPAVEKVAVLGKTSDEMVQEANNNVLNYRRNKGTELSKEDKTMSMDEIMAMFG